MSAADAKINVSSQSSLRVAIVVPTYNEAETLPVLIEKVLEQNIDKLGFVVVDDGSPDGGANGICGGAGWRTIGHAE